MPHLRSTFAGAAFLVVFVLAFAFPASGQQITSFASTRRTSRSMSGMSSGSESVRPCLRSPLPSHTVPSEEIRDVSAPAASRRGLMVSARPSSAESMTTPPAPASHSESSGKGLPVDTLAAMSRTTALLPSPGSPSSTESLPKASQPRQSQATRSVSTSETRMPPDADNCPAKPEDWLALSSGCRGSECASKSAPESPRPLAVKLLRPGIWAWSAGLCIPSHVGVEALPVDPDRAAHPLYLDLVLVYQLPQGGP